MSKFNLKTFSGKTEKEDMNLHNEVRLQRDHAEAPQEITQKQLEKDRIDEKNVLTEKLLEEKRTGGADKITERDLNESKSTLTKHRNAEAHSGDLNKLEEQRISKKKMEDEKAELASSTPKKKRWWEDIKAKTDKKVVTAAIIDEERDVSGIDFEDKDRWGRLQKDWSEDEGVGSDPNEKKGIDEILPDDLITEENATQPLVLDQIKPIDTPIAKGLFISFDVSADSQMSVGELQEAAYNAVMDEGYDYLRNVDSFTPDSFMLTRSGDKLVARLIGEEYLSRGQSVEEETMGSSPFKVESVQETQVEGVVIGTVKVDAEMLESVQNMDEQEVRRQILDAITEADESISVEPDGIDIDNIASGSVSFVGQRSVSDKGRSESYENVVGSPIASTDFQITVLSQSTKKK